MYSNLREEEEKSLENEMSFDTIFFPSYFSLMGVSLDICPSDLEIPTYNM
jgi:hypothetical protein